MLPEITVETLRLAFSAGLIDSAEEADLEETFMTNITPAWLKAMACNQPRVTLAASGKSVTVDLANGTVHVFQISAPARLQEFCREQGIQFVVENAKSAGSINGGQN